MTFIARMKEAIGHIEQARDIFAGGPLDFYLCTLVEHSEALLTRFAPLKVGQRAAIAEHIECRGGWAGREKTLAIGATGRISEVHYYDGAFWFDFVPDVEWWIDMFGKDKQLRSTHSYRLRDTKLAACPQATMET